jgi:signal transduction histidine kinase/ligand-binding sensor domain-containing protein
MRITGIFKARVWQYISRLAPGLGDRWPQQIASAMLFVALCSAAVSGTANALPQSHAVQNEGQQSQFAPQSLTQYVHKTWTFNGGLPGTAIRAIVQTSDGFLWLGTDGGLARFDGLNFRVFDRTNTPAMTSEDIHSLATGSDGSLWIGTQEGLLRLKDGIFTRYTEKDGLGGNNIAALRMDRNGTLSVHVFVSAGLPRFSQWNNGKFVAGDQRAGLLASLSGQCFGQSMLQDRSGDTWRVTFPVRGLSVTRNGKETRYTVRNGLSSNNVNLLFEDQRGTIWIRTDKAVNRFVNGKIVQYRLRPGELEPDVTCVQEDKRGDLWFQTRDDGIFRWNRQGVSHFGMKEGLSSESVRLIFDDRDGNHWIITSKGLDLLQEGFFISYGRAEGITDESSLNLMEARDGSIWVGTRSGKLYRLSGDGITEYLGLTSSPLVNRPGEGYINRAILSIYQTRDEQIWVSSVAGLKVFKKGKLSSLPGVTESIYGVVETMYEDPQGVFWVGTDHGLVRFKNGKYINYSTEPGAAINAVSVIAGSTDGGLWIGTAGGGLRHFKEGAFHDYTMTDGLSSNLITSLFESTDGTLWIGTPRGLNSFKDGSFSKYATDARHALQNHICAIVEDQDRHLWISSAKEIIRVSAQELEDFAAGKGPSWSYATYGIEDGIRGTCRQGTQPVGMTDHLGNLWFATNSGVVRVDPLSVSRGMTPLHIFLDNVSADLIPIDPIRGGSVPPGKNDLEFHYGVVSFRNPNKIQFRFRLLGFNQSWTEANTRRSAYYTNLTPGRYQFQVQVRNMDGTWNETGASIEINLRPEFYQTLWFLIFCLLTLILSLAGLYVIRKRQLATQMQQRLEERLADRTRIAQELHDTFLQDIVGLVFNIELASNDLALRPDDAKGRLQGVLHQLRQTVAAGRRALTDLRSPNISYGDLANALQRLSEQLRSETGPKLKMRVEGSVNWLPPLIGDEVFQISREALFNAIRHAGARTIDITLSCTERELTLRIADDGCGIESEILHRGRSGHFGLQGMKERAERIGAQFCCRSLQGVGTEIVLSVALPARSHRRSSVFRQFVANWLIRRKNKEPI